MMFTPSQFSHPNPDKVQQFLLERQKDIAATKFRRTTSLDLGDQPGVEVTGTKFPWWLVALGAGVVVAGVGVGVAIRRRKANAA